jgi:hypothetical protein
MEAQLDLAACYDRVLRRLVELVPEDCREGLTRPHDDVSRMAELACGDDDN